jgi:hypothetical protein
MKKDWVKIAAVVVGLIAVAVVWNVFDLPPIGCLMTGSCWVKP